MSVKRGESQKQRVPKPDTDTKAFWCNKHEFDARIDDDMIVLGRISSRKTGGGLMVGNSEFAGIRRLPVKAGASSPSTHSHLEAAELSFRLYSSIVQYTYT